MVGNYEIHIIYGAVILPKRLEANTIQCKGKLRFSSRGPVCDRQVLCSFCGTENFRDVLNFNLKITTELLQLEIRIEIARLLRPLRRGARRDLLTGGKARDAVEQALHATLPCLSSITTGTTLMKWDGFAPSTL